MREDPKRTLEELSGEEIDPITKASDVEEVANKSREMVNEIKDKRKREEYLKKIKILEEEGDLNKLWKLYAEIEGEIGAGTGKTTEEKKIETKKRKKEKKTRRTEPLQRRVVDKGTISFDAIPHIAYYSITIPKYSDLYKMRVLPLWDWKNEIDIRKRMSLNFILGTEDEVKGFFSGIERGQFIRDLNYEIISEVKGKMKRLVLRVGEQYASLENDLREIMRNLVKGHYGQEELKKFLRAGLITRILQDNDLNWNQIQDLYGDWGISLETDRFGIIERIDTKFSLNDLEPISPRAGKTFTEHLRTKLNVWIPKWGIREGELLYAFRDTSNKYDTVNQIIERDVEIGKALEEGDVYKMPLTGIKKVQGGAVHKRFSFVYSLGEDFYKKYPQFYPDYLKMIHRFPNVIWDYISNFKQLFPHSEALPEAELFLDFIKNRKLRGGQTYIQLYGKETGKTIDFSQLNFTQKVGETLQENLEELGLKEEQIDKIRGEVEGFVSKNENFIKSFYQIENKARQIQDTIISSVEAVKKGTMTEQEALEAILPELKKFAKEYGYEIDPEDFQKYLDSVLEYREKYPEMREELEKLMRLYNAGEIDERTYSEGVKRILKDKKIDMEKTWEKDIKVLQEKFGDKLGNLTNTPEGVGFLKRIWRNRAFKRAFPIFIIGGGIWGLYTLLRKDKKEDVKPPVAVVEEKGEGRAVATETEEFRPIYLFPNLWNEYKLARENYKQAVQSYTRGIMNFILMSSIFADGITDIPASDLIRLKVLAEWEGKDFSKLAQGYVVAKRRGITPKTLAELEFYAGIEEPDRMKLDKIASMLEKIYNMNVKMNERLLMQAYDRYKMFMRANIDIIKSQFREWQKRQTLLWKAKELQQNNEKELGMLMAIEAYRKGEEKEKSEAGR